MGFSILSMVALCINWSAQTMDGDSMSTFNFEEEYAKLTPEQQANYNKMMEDIQPSLDKLMEVSTWRSNRASQ